MLYEAAGTGRLRPEVDLKMLRLLGFGAINWCAEWFNAKGAYDPDEIADAAFAMIAHGVLLDENSAAPAARVVGERPMEFGQILQNLVNSVPAFHQATVSGNVKVMSSLFGPAWRGLILQTAKNEPATTMPLGYGAHFDWQYKRDHPEMRRLYEMAKKAQWNATTDVDWSVDVDPYNPERALFPEHLIPTKDLPIWKKMTKKEQAEQARSFLSWLLSQFLHGEQGRFSPRRK
ncbi:MAG: hypothetical protein M5R36_16320 [Deltaproteobacteria bacterium]|nr:hypothetical protein [Deltaproteobacteria bacterium]